MLHDLPQEVMSIGDLMPSLSPRKQREDPAHIRMLAEVDGDTGPILVHRPTMRVIDGTHRLRAAALKGSTRVTVRLFDGDEADAFVLAVHLNIRHGLPLTLDERKAAARRIVSSHPHWSDRAIAERTGLSAKTVGKVRTGVSGDAPHHRLGRDGRLRPVSSIEGRRRAAALLTAEPEISLRELSRRTGLSVGTVRDVRDRLGRGLPPVPERLRVEEERQVKLVPSHPMTMPGPGNVRARPTAQEASRPQTEMDAAPSRAETNGSSAETASVVRKLVRDPSLRATESGRALLRMLMATELERTQWEQIAEAIPTHCVPLIRAVVLKRCEDWRKLASMVPCTSE